MTEKWTRSQDDIIKKYRGIKTNAEIAQILGRSEGAVRNRAWSICGSLKIPQSSYPEYNEPLKIETDKILILPDVEAPFQNAEFIDRVIDLARSWEVEYLLCAGDLFHIATLSKWEPNWTKIIAQYMDNGTKDELMAVVEDAPHDIKEKVFEILQATEEKVDNTFAQEVRECKKLVRSLTDNFGFRYAIMGNHEGRLLRTMNASLEGQNLADIFGMDGWTMSEYYFAIVKSGGEEFRIAHPKPYSKDASANMASRFLCHYIMGHSHDWSQRFDRSGRFWAISMGHCASETRFPYESQRDRMYWEHVPGAVIIRNGYPYLLSEKMDWKYVRSLRS